MRRYMECEVQNMLLLMDFLRDFELLSARLIGFMTFL
jgi:hypothetical protein